MVHFLSLSQNPKQNIFIKFHIKQKYRNSAVKVINLPEDRYAWSDIVSNRQHMAMKEKISSKDPASLKPSITFTVQ